MFKRVLIANRGEIAVRIIRCLREMGIESVLVYSEADKASLPVLIANQAVCIGPARASESYLKVEAILEVAKQLECDAIHPGYGFLSENADFAKRCEEEGIVFIGPSSEIIARMGDKQEARKLMILHQVPVVPGSKELIASVEEAKAVAGQIGYPVLIKASAGGGGKGMRKAFCEEELEKSFLTAKAEATAAFGNDDMYLEKLVLNPHHVEIQIIADQYGNIVSLGERDCSIQRNNQKLLEEAPSPFVDENIRNQMEQVAIRAARAAGYNSVGTIEFVVDEEQNFYFIEMNTRVQVEHPVTEELTGVDIVREQIRIAAGMKLSVSQEEISKSGHTIECRINAASAGKVDFLHLPQGLGVRVETFLYSGYEISPFYDSMVAKLIVKGKTRLDTIRKLRRCLEELILDGVKTNTEFMYALSYHPDFIKGNYNTGFWEKNQEQIQEWLDEGRLS